MSCCNQMDMDNEEHDLSFNLDTSMKSDTDHMVDAFCEEWVTSHTRKDRTSLDLFLSFQLSAVLGKRKLKQ